MEINASALEKVLRHHSKREMSCAFICLTDPIPDTMSFHVLNVNVCSTHVRRAAQSRIQYKRAEV